MRKIISFILWRVACPVVYRIACMRRIDPKRILFVHDLDHKPLDNFIPVMQCLQARGYTCVFYGGLRGGEGSPVRKLLRFLLDYPRARAVFLTEVSRRLDICRPRRGTDIIQMWHACGGVKQWGYATKDLSWGTDAKTFKWFPSHRFYSCISVAAPAWIPIFAKAFNSSEEIVPPWGVPRTDFYFKPGIADKCRKKVLEAYPDIGERKILLYAPTFRGDNIHHAQHDDVLDYSAMEQDLGETCALLLRPHPRAGMGLPAAKEEGSQFVFDASQLPIEALLGAADLVMTDYSSIIFEYALFGRPMLFYAYDMEDYEKSRGFCYPYLEFVPGDLVWDTEGIIDAVRRNLFEGQFDPARVEAFREKFMSACDGHSTARIVKNVLGA